MQVQHRKLLIKHALARLGFHFLVVHHKMTTQQHNQTIVLIRRNPDEAHSPRRKLLSPGAHPLRCSLEPGLCTWGVSAAFTAACSDPNSTNPCAGYTAMDMVWPLAAITTCLSESSDEDTHRPKLPLAHLRK